MREEQAAFVDVAAERAVVGSVLSEPQLWAELEGLLTAEDFSVAAHAVAWSAFGSLKAKGWPVDLQTMATELRATGKLEAVGGVEALADLQAEIATTANAGYYARTVRDRSIRRRLAKGLQTALAQLQGTAETEAVLDKTMRGIAGLALQRRELVDGRDLLINCVDAMEAAASGQGPRIVSTGFPTLDEEIMGWPATLCVIGALPGVGKSAVLASTVRAMAMAGVKVGVFSLEDEPEWLGWRWLADASDVRQSKLRTGKLSEWQKDACRGAFDSLGWVQNVIVDGRSALTPRELVGTARDMILNHGCGAIVVDHLGELRYEANHGDRFDLDLADGLTDLRSIAKTEGVPIIAAAHFKRRPGLGPGDEPLLTDFANGSAIERKARVAIGLARTLEPGKDDVMRVHVIKNTMGGRAGVVVELDFHGEASMVRDTGRSARREGDE